MTANYYSRRTFIKNSLFFVGAAAIPSLSFASLMQASPRFLQMHNIHTGETLNTQYFDGRQYPLSELHKINHFCRDFRQHEAIAMDKTLFDQISAIQQILGCNNQVQVISGFRSAATNKMLRERSEGVAKKSLHMQGKAIDFRIEGVALADVKKAALSLKAGGVGYYPNSNFVHIDSGRCRSW